MAFTPRKIAIVGASVALAVVAMAAIPAAGASTYSVAGKVTVPSGVPSWWLGSTVVCAEDASKGVQGCADVDGTTGAYTIPLSVSGSYVVTAYPGWDLPDGTATADQPNLIREYYPGTWYLDDAKALSVAGNKTGVNIALDKGRKVSGKVSTSSGGSLSSVWIWTVSKVDGETYLSYPEEDGSFTQVGLRPEKVATQFSWDTFSDVKTSYASVWWGGGARIEDAKAIDLSSADQNGVNGTLQQIRYFKDSTSNTFYPEIQWFAQQGITNGVTLKDGTFEFRPLANVRRDAMAAFLYRYAGSPAYTPPKKSPFRDVPTSHVFYKEITWMASKGITKGYSDGTFRPLGIVKRDQMAVFMYRLAGSPKYSPPSKSPFTDVSTKRTFYKEIAWFAQQGITRGYETPKGLEFRPTSTVRRDAMAAFIYRFDQR